MQIGVIGLNHKLASLAWRERLAQACEKRFGPRGRSLPPFPVVLISTCNRTEVYFSSEDLPETHTEILHALREELQEEFQHRLYSYFGTECFHHLASVTAGLDSAIIGETEIQGQVKNAYEDTSKCRSLPHDLHYLFQKSLRIGKKVRKELLPERATTALEKAIWKTGIHTFEDAANASVLFVGASEINSKVIEHFRRKELVNLTLCNRSRKVAEESGLQVLPWERMDEWVSYDWVIVATKYPGFLFEEEALCGAPERSRLLIDLSVPRNIHPKLAKHPGTHLLNIDQVNRVVKGKQVKLTSAIAQAEEMIEESVVRLEQIFHKRRQYVATQLQAGFA